MAVAAGADIVGMLYHIPVSKRNNDLKNLKVLARAAGQTPVAVLVRDLPADRLEEMLDEVQPAILHCCGSEGRDERRMALALSAGLKIWQTVGVPLESPGDPQWLGRVEGCLGDPEVSRVVLDSARQGAAGGTGEAFPFAAVAGRLGEAQKRIVLAGGLNPDNVIQALKLFKACGVDVSSGVESSPGVKDEAKVRRLIGAVKGF